MVVSMFVFQMLIDIGVLVLCGQLLEPLWGALEFLVNNFNYNTSVLLIIHLVSSYSQ